MANISSLSQRLIAAGVTADQLTAQGRRFWGDDTAWSEPGETAGKPDRYQFRVYRGLRLHAGANTRGPTGKHLRSNAPWSASCLLDSGQYERNTPGAQVPAAASGACATQAEARAAAEAAADAFLASLAPALDGAA